MSVLIVTSVGELVVDLDTDLCPRTTYNFLKLCKMKYYNGCLFHSVQKDFIAQTGDPTGTGEGGDSVYRLLHGGGDHARFFDDEICPELTHAKLGTVAMASAGENRNASQFYVTLRPDVGYLDGTRTVFGTVALAEPESLATLRKINEAYVDLHGRPYKDIRIKHTYVLDDPHEDPPQLARLVPENSPRGKPKDEIAEERLEDTWVPLDERLDPAQLEEMTRSKEARNNAAILEILGDIPYTKKVKPPESVLFDNQVRRDTRRRKIQKLDDWRAESPHKADLDRKGRHDAQTSYDDRSGHRSYSRHDNSDNSKRHCRSRDQELISRTTTRKNDECRKEGRHKRDESCAANTET